MRGAVEPGDPPARRRARPPARRRHRRRRHPRLRAVPPHRPAAALTEAARVLRPGGRVAAITWAWERASRAGTVWDQTLTEAGVPPAPPRRVDAGLDRPAAMEALLRTAGLRPDRIWTVQLRHQWNRSSFWELATGWGANRARLSRLDTTTRARVPARAHSRPGQLTPRTTCGKARSSARRPSRAPATAQNRTIRARPCAQSMQL